MHDHSAALPRLWTARELAERTRIPLARIYELGRTGRMPVIRLGRAMKFDPEAVAAWLRDGGTASKGSDA